MTINKMANDFCPKCDYKKLKTFDELTDDEIYVLKARPSKFSWEERKKHRFCPRCRYEESFRETVC